MSFLVLKRVLNTLLDWDLVKMKCMSFLIKDKQLLRKYNEIWGKVNSIINKRNDN